MAVAGPQYLEDPAPPNLSSVLSRYRMNEERLVKKCSDQVLLKIASKLSEWDMIGRHLNVPKEKLKAIMTDHVNIQQEQKAVCMLDTWQEKEGSEATYLKLARALLEQGRRDLVELLCQILTTCTTDKKESRSDKSDVALRIEILDQKFTGLHRRLQSELTEGEGVSAVEFLHALSMLPIAFRNEYEEKVQELLPVKKKHDKKVTDRLFLNFSPLFIFLDFSLLQHLISKFGSDELKEDMAKYVDEVTKFMRTTTVADVMDLLPGQEIIHLNYSKVKAKFSGDPRDCTLEKLNKIRRSIISRVRLSEFIFWIISMESAESFIVYWLIPTSLVPTFKEGAKYLDSLFCKDHNLLSLSVHVIEPEGNTRNKDSNVIILKSEVQLMEFGSAVVVVSEDIDYLLYHSQVFYLGHPMSCQIHFVVTLNTPAHLTVVKKEYEEKGAIPGPCQEIIFESDEIFLDIPLEGISVDGWTITPFKRPVVTKKEIVNFKPGKTIPCCILLACYTWKGKVSPFLHEIHLMGAKRPFDYIKISLPAALKENIPSMMDRSTSECDLKNSVLQSEGGKHVEMESFSGVSTATGTPINQMISSDIEQMEAEEATIDYSLKLESGKKIREYQKELAEPGIKGENCIVVAPTGSGKTLVAALVISHHLQKNQLNKEGQPRVLFVVNTRPLAEQQKKELTKFIPNAQVECSMGDSGPTISDLLNHNDIIVCTAGKLLDSIKAGVTTFDMISLMVIDECHHTKKRSPQANIMVRYFTYKAEKDSKLPQVMGLTASPGAGDNPNLDPWPKTTIDHLVNLCAHLDASGGIVTVKKHQEELDEHTNRPNYTLEISQQRDTQEQFIQTIVGEIMECEKQVPFMKSAFPKWSAEYETNVQQHKKPLELSTDPKFRDQISILRLLRCYSQALNIYMDLRCEDAIHTLERFDGLPSDDSQASPQEIKLKQRLHHVIIRLKSCPPVQNPLLRIAEDKISTVFSENPHSKGIFFVRTKKHARAVCDWIESGLATAPRLGIIPRVLTGHTRETGTGMNQVAQEEVMDSFRNGQCNLLIATSVAEEGLDVPACNFVIRFQHVSNEIAKEQITGRARAVDSEGFTILSCGSKKSLQELKNDELIKIVDKCISNQWVPNGPYLYKKIKEQQGKIGMYHKQLSTIKKRKTSMHDARQVQLKCKSCKFKACYGSDIYLIASTHCAVPDEMFRQQKIVRKSHPKPCPLDQAPEFAKTHKIHCAKCDADWGISVIWPVKRMEIPVLKCKSFTFEVNGFPHSVSKWTDAPFDILDFSVWLEIQSQSDECDDS